MNQDEAAAPEPADDLAGGLVIEHHQQGTLVHGTEKNDQQLRRFLREQGFRWSGNLSAWYLPRPWTFSTRNQRVTGLTASLRQARRSFTMRNQPPAPGTAPDSPPEPVSAGELKPPQPQDQESLDSPAPTADAHAGTGKTAQAGAAQDEAAPAAPGSDAARAGTTASLATTGQEPDATGAPGEAAAGGQQPGTGTGAKDGPAQRDGTLTPGQQPPTGAGSLTTVQRGDASRAAAAAKTMAHPAPGEAAASDDPAPAADPESAASPLNNSDLAIALRRLPGFARLVSQAATPAPGGSRDWRRDGEADAGAHQALDCDANGIEITISGPGFQRYGHLTWPQIASWVDAGMTPARLGLIVVADRLSVFCRSHRDELIAAGKCDPDAAASELAQIRDDAISTVVTVAVRTRGAAAPVPPARPGEPSFHTAAMITRPDPAAGKEDNAALERLAQLRAAIGEPQPISDAEVKTTIRRWIGDDLPGCVRALGRPATMRAWINGQVTTRASRPVTVTYDTPGRSGGRWYGASPEGLLTARGGDDRADTLIAWEEIPAWIQSGITTSLRDRLLTADDSHRAVIRQRLTAAAHPQANLTGPSDQKDEQSARLCREVIADAWAAIEAAPPPAPAQLEYARRTYRDTGPAQETLFDGSEPARQQDTLKDRADDPAAPGQPPVPAETGHAADPGDTVSSATAGSTPAEPARHQDASTSVPIPAVAGARRQQHETASAARPQPGSTGTPLSADDILLGLSRLPRFVFADLIGAMDSGQALESVSRQLAPYSGERAAGEPDTGAREAITPAPGGLRIEVAAGHGTRAGLLSWAEIANWLRPGLTPARRQITCRATEIRLRFTTVNASFRAAGEAGLAADAEHELRNLASAAVSAVLDAARAAHMGQPGRGSQQSLHADDEAAALERINHLAAALPAWPPRWRKPVSQVQAGDIIGHPGYKLQPFRVSAPPQHHDDRVEITGHLTGPAEGEPAGETTWTLARSHQADPAVHLVPVPARSLRRISPIPARPTARRPGLTQDSGPGNGTRPHPPAIAAGTPTTDGKPASGAPVGAPIPIPGDAAGISQPHSTAAATKEENTMPPSPKPAPVPPAEPAATTGPSPAGNSPAGTPGPGPQGQSTDPPARQHDSDARLQQELEDVLTAIIEHRRATAPDSGSVGDDFADIRAAFTTLRNALELPAPAGHRTGSSRGPRPADPVPGPATADPSPAAGAAAPDGHAPQAGDFADIRAAFADLRHALDLPAHGGHSRDSGPRPAATGADPASDRLLDKAAAEAQACARWYRDTPEWQRITTVGRAAQNLLTAIQEACGDYWDEIRQDIRVRGFTRTLAARACLAVSGTAHILAARIERAGHKDTRIWSAAWGLHRATATFADRIMRYTPPAHPGRMNEARQIIGDLGQRPRNPERPGAARAATPGSRAARPPSPVVLASASFPVPVSGATAGAAAGPASRTATAPLRQPHVAHHP